MSWVYLLVGCLSPNNLNFWFGCALTKITVISTNFSVFPGIGCHTQSLSYQIWALDYSI
jgi:hypothetical protein